MRRAPELGTRLVFLHFSPVPPIHPPLSLVVSKAHSFLTPQRIRELRRQWMALGLAVVALRGSTVVRKALIIAPPPGPQRMAGAQTVIVGKVTAIEEKTVETSPAAGAPKVLYRVAVVKIGEDIKGGQ